MFNPYVILAALGIWLASLLGVGVWQHKAGVNSVNAAWQAKYTKEVENTAAQIQTLQNAARATEQAKAAELTALAATYEQEKQNAKRKTDTVITDLRSGAVKLRDPGAYSLLSDCSACAGTTPASRLGNGETGTELSATTSEFLVTLTGEADEVVQQLTACQAVIEADRNPAKP